MSEYKIRLFYKLSYLAKYFTCLAPQLIQAMITLDDTDKKILSLLQNNAKLTIREIAAQLSLSTTPIFDRIKRLEKNKIILKQVVLVDPKQVGKKLTCFIHIKVKDHSLVMIKEFTRKVAILDEVMECHSISGDADYMLKVVVSDMDEFNEFLITKLTKVPNIFRQRTEFALSCIKYSTALKNI